MNKNHYFLNQSIVCVLLLFIVACSSGGGTSNHEQTIGGNSTEPTESVETPDDTEETPDDTEETPDDTEETPDDADSDGVLDSLDNCLEIANADQTDTDNDSEGDACDSEPLISGEVAYLQVTNLQSVEIVSLLQVDYDSGAVQYLLADDGLAQNDTRTFEVGADRDWQTIAISVNNTCNFTDAYSLTAGDNYNFEISELTFVWNGSGCID